ncbi:hypothetical protein [Halogeometricum luteum]|uniref:MBL fold metallo-hydrolase n=1 Tax=Halogeometricum luteum TaxID=2950537 RepID=A0ABU2G5X9_9EURY|nr:hypothetical protein [Halogeometricum sp. S3BR5-2]MDS0296180.1 hypothetical protein [Halogeometricum sp. S3BR5-2]
MTMYDRGASTEARLRRWDGGLSWLAFPGETAERCSHALGADGGVWLLDPLDAPGVDEAVAELGPVEGVAVLSAYHARDAAAFADRYDVPVSLPRWLPRVEARVDAPVERFDGELGTTGLRVREYAPLPGWSEAIAHRPADGTLYAPDTLGTASPFTVDGERLGLYLFQRFVTPKFLHGYDPERILVGHGDGVFQGAAAALEDAVANGRRRLPWALVENGTEQVRALVAALDERG